jgi:hypothetical protein
MKKLVDALNREFGEPFLPKDHVVAAIDSHEGKPILRLKVGKREVELNSKMEVRSAGTAIGYPGVFYQSR